MSKKRFLISIVTLLLVLSMIVGCGTTNVGEQQDTANNVAEPVNGKENSKDPLEGKKDSITVAIPADVPTLFQWGTESSVALSILNNMMDPLFRIDPRDGSFYGWLAEEWKISDDGTEVKVKLHEGVKFSNGDLLTSEDVKWTLETAKSEPFCARWVTAFEGIEVIDDYNFIMKFEYYFPNMLKNFSTYNMNIMPAKYFQEVGREAYAENPIGSGPFIVEKVIPGDRIIFKANKEYFRGAPSYETLIVKIMQDNNSALMALEAGDVDVVHDLKPNFKSTVESNEDLKWEENISTVYVFMQLNNQKEPLNDPRVRRALNIAINRDQIQQVALNGGGLMAPYGISPYSSEWSDDDPIPKYDPEEARKLLAEAGYPDGFDITLTCRAGDYQKPAAEIVMANWEDIGVKTNVDVMERNAQLSDLISGNYEAGWQQLTDFLIDATTWSSTQDSNHWGEKGNNRSLYKNERFDELNKLQLTEMDDNKRSEYFNEMKEIYLRDTPNLPGFFAPVSVAANKDLDIYASLSNFYRYEWFSWK